MVRCRLQFPNVPRRRANLRSRADLQRLRQPVERPRQSQGRSNFLATQRRGRRLHHSPNARIHPRYARIGPHVRLVRQQRYVHALRSVQKASERRRRQSRCRRCRRSLQHTRRSIGPGRRRARHRRDRRGQGRLRQSECLEGRHPVHGRHVRRQGDARSLLPPHARRAKHARLAVQHGRRPEDGHVGRRLHRSRSAHHDDALRSYLDARGQRPLFRHSLASGEPERRALRKREPRLSKPRDTGSLPAGNDRVPDHRQELGQARSPGRLQTP